MCGQPVNGSIINSLNNVSVSHSVMVCWLQTPRHRFVQHGAPLVSLCATSTALQYSTCIQYPRMAVIISLCAEFRPWHTEICCDILFRFFLYTRNTLRHHVCLTVTQTDAVSTNSRGSLGNTSLGQRNSCANYIPAPTHKRMQTDFHTNTELVFTILIATKKAMLLNLYSTCLTTL